MRILIIANPNAGGFKKISIKKIEEYLIQRGSRVTVHLTTRRGDAHEFSANVKKGEFDVVVAAGGDGTVNEVINGLADRGINFGIIPVGTVNVVALETGIPFDPIGACDVILQNNLVTINLGKVNDMYFILMASCGFDAHVVRKVHKGLKACFGRFSYMIQGVFLLMTYSFPKISVNANGKKYTGYGVIVSNMKLYAGKGIFITKNASFLNDDFEVCVIKKKGRLTIFRFLFHVLSKTQHRFHALKFFNTRELTLESDKKCSVQVDGDGIGHLPRKIIIAKDALTIMLPK